VLGIPSFLDERGREWAFHAQPRTGITVLGHSEALGNPDDSSCLLVDTVLSIGRSGRLGASRPFSFLRHVTRRSQTFNREPSLGGLFLHRLFQRGHAITQDAGMNHGHVRLLALERGRFFALVSASEDDPSGLAVQTTNLITFK
jgi:hypothetical protein